MIQLLYDPNIQFSLKNGAINTARNTECLL